MKKSLVKFLVCPRCKKSLSLTVIKKNKGEVKEGSLSCFKCRKKYPITDYIPRFVKTDKYVNNFSFEWQLHKTTQLDSYHQNRLSEIEFIEKTGLEKKDLKGSLVLDVGCGMGRYTEIASKFGAEVVGVDLSFAVDTARSNLKNNLTCQFIQADINLLPFKSKIFDAIFSIGVLHHTPNTKKSFMVLPPLLKSGGKLAVWVYGSNTFKRYDLYLGGIFRRLSQKLPKKLVYFFSYFSVLFYYIYQIPFFGSLFNLIIPFSTNPDWRWRVLDTYDWYSPKYQWKHTYPELAQWYEEAGLKVIHLGKYEASLLGVKNG